MKKENKKIVLIDSHAVLHRAYHALPQFSSSKGEPTGALYGLSTMLMKIITDLKPDYIAACFDLPQATYRHDAYKEYKAGRKKADDELVSQIKRSYDVYGAFGIPIYSAPGFEADDILGTIVEQLEKKSIDVIIASGDMDTLQLVDDKKVQVYTLKKGINDTILYDETAVRDRFGFGPEYIPDYKGLRGDPSDNIIGVKGVGDKTASALIQKYGTLEKMFKVLSKKPEEVVEAGVTERIANLLKENEEEAMFSKMLATIRRDAPIEFSIPENTWKKTVDVKKALELFDELEFRSLSGRLKDVCGVPNIPEEENTEEISEDDLEKAKIAVWVLDSHLTNPELSDVLRMGKSKKFDEALKNIEDAIKKNGLEKVYREIELPLIPVVRRMRDRGIQIDTIYLNNLKEKYEGTLRSIEKKIWKEAGEEFNINSPRQLGEILFEKLGLKVKGQKKTGTGAMSTRESELSKMRGLSPIIDEVLSYRELQKLLSTYIDTIPKLVDENSRLHATFVLTGTTTGRMASVNPNLQNIPNKTELGRNIRNGFVASKGMKLVELDYSQIELRVAAFLSGDSKLIEIFKSGRDVHTEVAASVFKVPTEQVDKEMRRRAKIINFGILYGMGVNALKDNLGTERAEAQEFYNEYFNTFSELAEYLEKIKLETEQRGYTETFYGRRRYFEGIKSSLPHIKAMALRMAINAPIQGTEADVIKLAMARIDAKIQSVWKDKTHLLLQVHDSLVYEIQEKYVDEIGIEISNIMRDIMTLEDTKGIPLVVHRSAGDTWGEMDELS